VSRETVLRAPEHVVTQPPTHPGSAVGRAPYATGDHVELLLPDGPRSATVSVVVESGASDPHRRWRLLCRDDADGRSIDVPIYCGDDGHGDGVCPADRPGPRLAGGATTGR
jgi:hypothetical protein